MNREQLASSLKAEIRSFCNACKDAMALSERDARDALAPGEAMPAEVGINARRRDDLDARADMARDGMRADVELYRAGLQREVAAAPSADAAAAMQVLAIRDNVSQAEIDAHQRTYGSNYSVGKALGTIARRNGLEYEAGPDADAAIEGLDTIERLVIARMTARSFTDGAFGADAYAAIMCETVDDALGAGGGDE